ncbi:hypothetical protein PC121_g1633 [Phytophthora cactorum]|nr:hypothetical protein PC121_g1633 [Phytophthora cactorum]
MPLFGRKKSRSSSSSSSSGTLDFSEVKLGKAVGAGRSGSTFSAHWNGRHVAAKVVDLSAASKKSLANELLKELRREEEVASALRHPNIVQFLGSASAPPRYCLVFEFMEGGTLTALVRAKSKAPLDFFRLANDMAQGHGQDLGLWPQLCHGSWPLGRPNGRDGHLLAKDIPFKGQTPMQTAMAVAEHQMRPALPRNTPPKIAELIEHCWNQDPTRRPDFSAIVKVLPFVKQTLSKTDFKNAGILYTA